MSKSHDLRQRRQALEAQLSTLRRRREQAFRTNSDALARQRAGVTDHAATEMQQFADDETAGDSEMTDLRRQIGLIDDELAKKRRFGGWLQN